MVTLLLFFSITVIVRADCESDTKVNNRSTCFLTDNQRIGIFGGLLGSLITLSALRAILFFLLMLNASRIVHNRMFARVLRAPILFFDTNPVGKHHIIIIYNYPYTIIDRSSIESIFKRCWIFGRSVDYFLYQFSNCKMKQSLF